MEVEKKNTDCVQKNSKRNTVPAGRGESSKSNEKTQHIEREMKNALNDLKDPKGDLYCLVRQFYVGEKEVNPIFDNCNEKVYC